MTKHTRTAMLAGVALAMSAGAASARAWMSINERQARLDERMEAGIRSGDLSPSEAMSLRAEYRAVVRLDMRYRRGGYVTWEMADRDRRVDAWPPGSVGSAGTATATGTTTAADSEGSSGARFRGSRSGSG